MFGGQAGEYIPKGHVKRCVENGDFACGKHHGMVRHTTAFREDFRVTWVFFPGKVETLLVKRSGDNGSDFTIKGEVNRFVKAIPGNRPTPGINFTPIKTRYINFCSLKDIHLIGNPERLGGFRYDSKEDWIFG
jgi:hypothetical protein